MNQNFYLFNRSYMEKQIIDAAEEMRAAQKLYFRTRNPSALSKSKSLERRLDCLLEESRGRQTKHPELF